MNRLIRTCIVALGFAAVTGLAGQQLAAEESVLTVKGSDTMVPLTTAWAEAFMDKQKDIEVMVTGGGSGTGIAALLNKTTDLCASSRDLKPEEKEQATKNGLDIKETKVALDGLAIVVHPSNPLKEITLEALEKIYTGEAKNWKDVGGADEPIVALSRESSSGTYVFFQEHVLLKKDYAAAVRLMPATAAMIKSVTTEKSAIAYVGLGYAEQAGSKVKVLPVKKDVASQAVMPSEATVKSGEYSIARPLYLLTTSAKPAVKEFIDFALGADGQKIVAEEDYVSIS